MSDQLEALWRAWQASHAIEDEVAWLSERLRLGELTLVQLDLAAFCGHKAARQVIESTGAVPTPIPLEGWEDELARGWGEPTRTRYTEIALGGLNHKWEGQLSDTGEVEPNLERSLGKTARLELARETLAPAPR